MHNERVVKKDTSAIHDTIIIIMTKFNIIFEVIASDSVGCEVIVHHVSVTKNDVSPEDSRGQHPWHRDCQSGPSVSPPTAAPSHSLQSLVWKHH